MGSAVSMDPTTDAAVSLAATPLQCQEPGAQKENTHVLPSSTDTTTSPLGSPLGQQDKEDEEENDVAEDVSAMSNVGMEAVRRPSLPEIGTVYVNEVVEVMAAVTLEHEADLPLGHSPKTPVILTPPIYEQYPTTKESFTPPEGRRDSLSSEEDEAEYGDAAATAEMNGGKEEAVYQWQQRDDLDAEDTPRVRGSKTPPPKGFFDEDADFLSPGAPPANDTFRRRRLTFATQGNIPPHTPLNQIQQRMFRSLEIGDVPKVPLPFQNGLFGSYSCHGIEPAYEISSRPFIAKINQDRGVCVYPFAGHEKMALFAVFDGHGEQGDKVSEFCMYELPKALEAHPSLEMGEGDVTRAFKETFLAVDERLGRQPNIEPFYSGTTAVVGLIKGNRIWVANAGDSRCVLATADPQGSGMLVSQDLSIDQNPDSPGEMGRILRLGGFVSPPPEPGLSARVWLDENFTQVGLAMARSIGDHAVKGVGVIAEPEVLTHEIQEGTDSFLIFASDGVWEFISSQEAVDIVSEHLPKGISHACQMLIEHAAARWRDIEGCYRDDCSAHIVRLPIFS